MIVKYRDDVTGGSEGSADPPDFLKLQCKNAIKCNFPVLGGQFWGIFWLLTPLTFGALAVPG